MSDKFIEYIKELDEIYKKEQIKAFACKSQIAGNRFLARRLTLDDVKKKYLELKNV